MLRPYRFEHPQTEAMELITFSSYVAAAFFGPFYILCRKSSGFVPALILMLVLTGGMVAFSGLSSFFLPGRMQIFALPVVVVVCLMIQSSFVISRVRRSFRRRGWLIRAL
jgi:hypothetical protein